MNELTTPKIILGTDIRAEIAMKEVAKILTATEGVTSKEKIDEIASIFFGTEVIGRAAKDFFTKANDKVADVFDICVTATGIINILDAQRKPTRWIFGVSCARIPRDLYKTTTPEDSTKQVGTAVGIKLNKKYGFPVHMMYGDSRVYSGPCNTGHKENINIAYLFGYKENTGELS